MDAVDEVTAELIAEVLATATGISVVKLTEEESQRLLRMEDELHKRVIGQDVAIKSLSQAIRRTRAGLKDPKRPGGSFIFAGPSGVGKTELARTRRSSRSTGSSPPSSTTPAPTVFPDPTYTTSSSPV
jgi:ATP-dependent Clp protease ATP-binding subunit ClpC